MNIEKILRKYKEEIDKRLNLFFTKKIKELESVSPLASNMVREIRDFTMRGGKRIRPALVYYGYLAGGGKNKKAILDAAIFIELIHSYLLIHDDIIDHDKLRRGRPTLHAKYASLYREMPQNNHLGICAGIVAGDLICAFGYEVLAQSKFPQDFKNRALSRLSQIIADVIAGETLDVFLGIGYQLSRKDILKILEYKTARYTIEGPLHIGAILAGADKKTLQTLSRYAIPLGIAFQIKDDILGMFGDQKVTGKSISSDVKEGKQTLLISKARERANKKQKDIIAKVLGNPKATEKQIEGIKKIVVDTEALNYSVGEAEKLSSQAKSVIKKSNFSQDARQSLTEIADYILKRER